MPGNIYCGNNRNNPKVVNGQQRIGTKYTCLRAGIGVGKNLPYDPSYLNEYIPLKYQLIIKNKIGINGENKLIEIIKVLFSKS